MCGGLAVKRVLPLLALFFLVVLLGHEFLRKRSPKVFTTTSGRIEMCLACHEERPEKAHARNVVGCSPCHLGDPLRIDKDLAHRGIVKNPADLRVAEKTCGQPVCHPDLPSRVKKSLMATNRGIIDTLRRYWGEIEEGNARLTPHGSVRGLMQSGETSLALDYFRKLCGSCHLWLKKGQYEGFLGRKGGGCVACHLVPGKKEAKHPVLTKKIPVKNCTRCHNRSGRIGLTYQGLYESEGYGTPLIEGEFGAETLEDGRFVERIPPDLHYKAGLVCADCHLQEETMGDGKEYVHLEESVEIICEACHGGKGLSRKGRPIPGVLKAQNKMLFKDLQGKVHPLKPPDPINCRHKVHQRLSCQACHAPRVPQCYGCHVRRDPNEKQLDKISGRETQGAWEEFRSYMRYETPTLGKQGERVVILVPG